MAEAIDLQTLLKRHLPAYRQHHRLDLRRCQVLSHLMQCRTEAMGGVRLACDPCQVHQNHYYACRDRHCPHCQWRTSRQWADKQLRAQLPVTYHHLVFTLPETLNGWIELHPQLITTLLFQTTWGTLQAFAEDPKRLGGGLGMTAVLHTWGSTLTRHVQLHCLVPGGALGPQGEWKPSKSDYLFPVRALSRRFRGLMVSRLRACAQGGELSRISHPGEIDLILERLMGEDWVVYSKPCLHTEHVIDYLARYTHRTAVSNRRLLGLEQDQVGLRYKDYRDRRWKVMQLSVDVLIQRFLLHVLPKGLMRIRHYGFLANACRAKQLPRILKAIAEAGPQAVTESETEKQAARWCFACPCCQRPMRVVAQLAPQWQRMEGG
ncbi:MAG: IS91 family transposase [Candidatus Thiodiazotropha sp.]